MKNKTTSIENWASKMCIRSTPKHDYSEAPLHVKQFINKKKDVYIKAVQPCFTELKCTHILREISNDNA